MTQNRDHQDSADRSPAVPSEATGEAVGYFSDAASAEQAMLALQEAGYRSELREDVWETLTPRRRDVVLFTIAGVTLGFLLGTVLTLLWLGLTGAFPSGSTLDLPMTSALIGAVLYLGGSAVGGWLGYQYALNLHRNDPALMSRPDRRRFAVVAPLSSPHQQRAEVERILRRNDGVVESQEAA
ncbi:MAG: hypothetical protein NTZ05_14725 [Chloroflexi bacterium]|nr:hypothetical protein [Chloroflexota bacterium]